MRQYDINEPIYGSSSNRIVHYESLKDTEDYVRQHNVNYDLIKDYKPVYKTEDQK